MEPKFTKGPWQVNDTNDGVLYTHPTGFKFHVCLIGSGNSTTLTEEEEEANCLLIAAAPYLLEALEGLQDILNNHYGDDSDETPLIDKAFDAIKKAKGL